MNKRVKRDAQLFRRCLGNAIRRRRRSLGLSQVVFAKRCGLSQSCICEIEKGHQNITWESYVSICTVLDVGLARLILDTGFPSVL
ncbi:MAG: hypothetical protein G01um1014106_280 [Parcubacteria group bacterium Gr01-1014_106]|nr:MAG: hypothetical protein G01um1014106_280 [Parcubacteria group bacterium Gr01-1014_106]